MHFMSLYCSLWEEVEKLWLSSRCGTIRFYVPWHPMADIRRLLAAQELKSHRLPKKFGKLGKKKGNIIFHRYEPVKYIIYIPNFKLQYSQHTQTHIFGIHLRRGMNRDVLQNSTVVFPRLWVHKYGSQSPGGQYVLYINI